LTPITSMVYINCKHPTKLFLHALGDELIVQTHRLYYKEVYGFGS
jgi:hypothetical protein